jgi:hypothetical protein
MTTTNDELKAAAERLRAIDRGELIRVVYASEPLPYRGFALDREALVCFALDTLAPREQNT